jgi:outer membrane receptor protein involved in Fe transport
MAVGAEGRWDSATGDVDAISAAQGWWQNAGTPIDGSVTVTEGYLEADVPLAKSLTLNAADRETHYTTTGNANTWKVGLVWDATDMFRLRVTQSHDFRAPNMDELFGPTNSHPTILIDPTTNTQVFVTQHQGGNPNLQPETGDTTTFGVVFQGRDRMQGLKTSLDYYHIKIKDAVDIVNPQTILDRCAAGDQLYCQYVTRDSSGTVTDLTVTYLNLDKLDTSGLDLSADYTLPLGAPGSGTLSFGLIANYVYHLRLTDSAGHTVDRAGQTGLELLGTPGMPRYNINLLTTYAHGPGSVSLQARYIASGTFDPELIGPDKSNYDPNLPNSINRNTVASSWYADLAAKYDIYNGGSRNVQLFGAINNMFDKQPPFLPSFHNAIFFDNVGRYYTAGVRIKF